MEKITQDGRQISISTPLGKDFFLLNKFSVSEKISELFTIHAELLCQEQTVSFEPTVVDPSFILGQAVTILISQEDGAGRTFNGIVVEFSQGNRDSLYSYYFVTIVPAIWILTQNVQSRIFQHKSVVGILQEVFKGFEVSYELSNHYNNRNYCVQYRESDFAFASRLLEEEGIYYYFEHSDGKHKLVLGDSQQAHYDCPNKSEIPFLTTPDENKTISRIITWRTEYRLQSSKVTLWDHHFQLPSSRLEFSQPSLFGKKIDNTDLEIYDYPGGYSRKYDAVGKSGDSDESSFTNIFPDREKTVKNRMEAIDAQYQIVNGVADCSSMTAGHRFAMTTHPNKKLNGQYVLTGIEHHAEQSPSYVSDNKTSRAYEAAFSCIPLGSGNPTFRSLQKTPKPIVRGSQTAIVVGPDGDEIFTDVFGRVKVQFYWDRYGKTDSDSSCWVRVSQSIAGNKWGAMFIPRIGMEVVVNFLEGDPDQPIITGCVYNSETDTPYPLPEQKTKSTLKTNSSQGGGGFNEFRIEDLKGSEQIFVHGEKDLDVRVKNNVKETVENNRHLIVQSGQFEQIGADKHLKIKGDHAEEVSGAMSLTVGMDLQEKVQMKYAMDAGTEIHLKSGMTMTLETQMNLTLKVGSSFISITPAGVFISGPLVMVNSGGAAGSGSGSSPAKPKDASAADDGKAGKKVKRLSKPPPTKPLSYSEKSQGVQNAARNATPFVNIAGPKKSSGRANAKTGGNAASSTSKNKDTVNHSKTSKPGEKHPKTQTDTSPAPKSFVERINVGLKTLKEKKLADLKKEVKKTVADTANKVLEEGKQRVEKAIKDELK